VPRLLLCAGLPLTALAACGGDSSPSESSAPGFARHGEEGEQPALAEGAEVEFEDVELARE
jgi:hypothetical protein